jgi:chromate transporter
VTCLFLFAQFFQIGLFSIGGGLATLPFLYRLAEKQDWLSLQMIGNIQAVAQSLPGAIGVNMAAYTGFLRAGVPGALAAALGLISPSIAIIIGIARVLQAFKESALVKAVFSGLRPAAAGLLCAAGFGAVKLSLYNRSGASFYSFIRIRECILLAVIYVLIARFKGHPIIYIALAGIAGVVLGL